jgi:hypothetical protein
MALITQRSVVQIHPPLPTFKLPPEQRVRDRRRTGSEGPFCCIPVQIVPVLSLLTSGSSRSSARPCATSEVRTRPSVRSPASLGSVEDAMRLKAASVRRTDTCSRGGCGARDISQRALECYGPGLLGPASLVGSVTTGAVTIQRMGWVFRGCAEPLPQANPDAAARARRRPSSGRR